MWSTAQRPKRIYGFHFLSMDQLAMSSSVRWYGHVLRREDGDVLRRTLDFEIEGQRKKGRLKRTWKK